MKNSTLIKNRQYVTKYYQEVSLFHGRRREHDTGERAANSVFIGSVSLLMPHDQQGSLPVRHTPSEVALLLSLSISTGPTSEVVLQRL
jgi:hypothetical protein